MKAKDSVSRGASEKNNNNKKKQQQKTKQKTNKLQQQQKQQLKTNLVKDHWLYSLRAGGREGRIDCLYKVPNRMAASTSS